MTTPFELGMEIGVLMERMRTGRLYGDEQVHVANKPLIRKLVEEYPMAAGCRLEVEFADSPTDDVWTLATFTSRKRHGFGVVEGGKA